MLMKTAGKLLRKRWREILASAILIPVPAFVLTFLSLGSASQWLQARPASDPALDVALLVEPSVNPAGVSLAKNGDGVDNLMNWNYSPTAICKGS